MWAHGAKTTINPYKPETASSLVTSGICRITRNPMYPRMLLILVAWAVFLTNGLSALALVRFPVYIMQFQIKPEERALLILFDEAYARYKERVRRWI